MDAMHYECPTGEISAYQLIELATGALVQVGVCPDCGHVIARFYVVTGPGTGPWTVLHSEQSSGVPWQTIHGKAYPPNDRSQARREAWQQYPEGEPLPDPEFEPEGPHLT